ncbi:SRPBCC domain-containing protein [Puniceibacterium confluentis]|uniref:SRPBCC domain-containing protein n=2 Tax=Puniceibacterium confluentis TaxID=1958944 RepID=UPI0016457D51
MPPEGPVAAVPQGSDEALGAAHHIAARWGRRHPGALENSGTAYRALVLHASAEARKQHEDMGFHEGWGTVADQLDTLARTL